MMKRKSSKQPIKRLVKTTFMVTLVEYVTHEADSSDADAMEECVNDLTRDLNGTCIVNMIGKPEVIAGV
jgi:hypothetical protein